MKHDTRPGSNSTDYPFYDGQPGEISSAQWMLVLCFLAFGFAALIAPLPFVTSNPIGSFVPALLFLGLPLLGMKLVAPRGWHAIMRTVAGRDLLLMVGFGLLNVVVSFAIGTLLSSKMAFTANALVINLSHLSTVELELTLLRTLPQLFGEELLTILPFLAVFQLAHVKFGVARTPAIVLAWVISALIFGAAHLPTYGWNVVQAFGIIGIARLILTLAYMKTKNIWVSFGAHVVTDWSYFGLSLLLTRVTTGG